MNCPSCGSLNTEGVRFCNHCGTTMGVFPKLVEPSLDDSLCVPVFQADLNKPDPLIRSTIDGRYRLVDRIGSGGMGTVYRAKRLLIGDEVAVKILHKDVADRQAGERFRREAQTAARLKHPNAVTIHDFGITANGLQYLVMELVEGQSLRQVIKQQGPLTPSAASEVIAQVCAALDEAHRHNIVHRDVKPDNIIVNATTSGLRVKVLDFGIAKLRDQAASNLTQTGSVVGTPHYMSPEQCLGEELDSRSDIYSLGVVLYEILCGVVPFNSPTPTAVVVQHVNQMPPSLRARNVSISPAVDAVVLRALEKRREVRPQTAEQLARELQYAVIGHTARAPYVQTAGRHSLLIPTEPHSDEVTVIREPGPSMPPAVSCSSGMAPTVHVMAQGAISGGAKRLGAVSGSPSERAKSRSNVIRVVAVTAVVMLVLVLSVGTATFLILSSRDEGSINKNKNEGRVAQTGPSSLPVVPDGMVYVPGGEFLMGNDSGETDERPAHRVRVNPFFIDIYEVTCDEYQKFVVFKRYPPPASWLGGHCPAGAERHPVTGVNWDDAMAYATWAGKRLPTEKEWEFAARGTDGRRFPWGNKWKENAANAGTTADGAMSNVGEHSAGASPFGSFDMVGNAWEWTASDWKPYPGGRSINGEYPDPKVIRGGFWGSSAATATTTFRTWWRARNENTYQNTGFRCVKDVPTGSDSH